jgi:hypothetical protein
MINRPTHRLRRLRDLTLVGTTIWGRVDSIRRARVNADRVGPHAGRRMMGSGIARSEEVFPGDGAG